MQAVFLVGFMGAGKSTVGRMLAEQLGWTFEDLDQRIERRERQRVAEIFRRSGEAEFRRAEHAALRELLQELQAGAQKIVGLGGGAFVHKGNAGIIAAAGVPTVFLDAGVEELWRRCSEQKEQQGNDRPLLNTFENFRDLYRARRRHYLKAEFTQSTGGKSVRQIAQEIIQTLDLIRVQRGRAGER